MKLTRITKLRHRVFRDFAWLVPSIVQRALHKCDWSVA